MAGTPNSNKGGRPTAYHKSFDKIGYELCRQHGYTDEKLADLLSVGLTTLKRWKEKYEEFRASIRRGKDEFDGENVESALLKSAKGFIRKRLVKRTLVRGGLQQTETTEEIEEVAGSVPAQQFYLINRNPERWRRVPKEAETTEGESLGVLVVPEKEDYPRWLQQAKENQSNTT
jgi:hypothetical protein